MGVFFLAGVPVVLLPWYLRPWCCRAAPPCSVLVFRRVLPSCRCVAATAKPHCCDLFKGSVGLGITMHRTRQSVELMNANVPRLNRLAECIDMELVI